MAPNDGVDIAGTVRERAARELRDRILTGALPAGTRLDLDAITKEFATSRTPVREALLELSYDGLVRVAPRSGVTVIGIRPEDVLDSFTILGVLTGQAGLAGQHTQNRETVQHVLGPDADHRDAAARRDPHQSVVGQLEQRLAYRCAAGGELLGDGVEVEPGAGRQRA